MKIVKYNNCSDIEVGFQDEHKYIKHTTYNCFTKGQVKNPYDRDLYGVGYHGVGKWKVKDEDGKWSRVYLCWRHMLERCYHEKSSWQYPAYYGICTVCDEWKCFQTFAEWYKEREYDIDGRLHLDKDILFDGNKEYSPDKCLLVPQKINMLFMDYRPNKDGLPHGIGKAANGRYSSAYRGKSLGVFNTLEKAIAVHDIARLDYINEVTEGQKDTLPIKVYNALKNYVYRQRELMKVA